MYCELWFICGIVNILVLFNNERDYSEIEGMVVYNNMFFEN